MRIFIAGSHTNIGKTSVSAALCFAFGWEYFKLVQAGNPQDCAIIAEFAPNTKIHPNGITLKTSASPHIAMQRENIAYNGLEIPLPNAKHLLIESAGGLFSPLDLQRCMIDYLEHSKLPCLLVGGYYLGGINHILLSIHALKSRGIPLLCVIISGEQNLQMDMFLQHYARVKIAHLQKFSNTRSFRAHSQALKEELNALEIFQDS